MIRVGPHPRALLRYSLRSLSRRRFFQELHNPQTHDFSLLLRGHAQFVIRVVSESPLERGEHLAGAPAGRADDENVAETGFVVAIARGEPRAKRVAGLARS